MKEKSAVVTVTPKATGLDEFKATIEKLGRLSEELEEAIRELSDAEITVELEAEVNQ